MLIAESRSSKGVAGEQEQTGIGLFIYWLKAYAYSRGPLLQSVAGEQEQTGIGLLIDWRLMLIAEAHSSRVWLENRNRQALVYWLIEGLNA